MGRVRVVAAGVMLFLFVRDANALVCHPEDWPLPSSLPGGPPAQWMARINKGYPKPSAAVVGPAFIITAGHWGDMTGRTASIGHEDSDVYVLADVRFAWDFAVYKLKHIISPPLPEGYDVVMDPQGLLGDAALGTWAELYEGSDKVGTEMVLGSYGRQGVSTSDNVLLTFA